MGGVRVSRKVRFGLAGAPFGIGIERFSSVREWTDVARRAEALGFDTLLVPDGPKRFSAFQALAVAAAGTGRLRLGTMVVPVPLRTPGVIAWETATLDQLSGGRFELGLGSGHPANESGTRQLGGDYATAARRVALVEETIAAVESLAGAAPVQPVQRPRPPIMVAGKNDRLLNLAARRADIIHLGVATEEELARKVAVIRDAAGDRFEDLELSVSIFHIGGGEEPAWLGNYGIRPGVDHVSAIRSDDIGVVVDTLHRLRDEFGVSYFVIGPAAIEAATPVIARLAGT